MLQEYAKFLPIKNKKNDIWVSCSHGKKWIAGDEIEYSGM